MTASVPESPNRLPETPEEEFINSVLAKWIIASHNDDEVRENLTDQGLEAQILERRLYIVPRYADDVVPVDYKQMRCETNPDVNYGIGEIVVRMAQGNEDDVFGQYSDLFVTVSYTDGYPDEHYLVNGSGTSVYDTAEQIKPVPEDDLDAGGFTSSGDKFTIEPGSGQTGRRTVSELRLVMEQPVTILLQDPSA